MTVAFVDREASVESQTKGRKSGGISYCTLLNSLYGIGAMKGRVLCLTNNHIDTGRINLQFEFKIANQEQAKESLLCCTIAQITNDGLH